MEDAMGNARAARALGKHFPQRHLGSMPRPLSTKDEVLIVVGVALATGAFVFLLGIVHGLLAGYFAGL